MNTAREREDALTLELLDVIDREKGVSQRSIARHLGVALGLANSYLKRCARKGLIKISAAPAHRYLYYLTPKGFAEKSRLTAQYLSVSLSFYRKAGESCLRVYDECEQRGWRRLLLCGVSDLAEIATFRAMEREITILGFLDLNFERDRYLGRPVWRSYAGIDAHDACVLTDLSSPTETFHKMQSIVVEGRILVPDILSVADEEH